MKRSQFLYTSFVFLIFFSVINGQEKREFTSFKEVLEYVKVTNHQFKNAEWQTRLADLARKTAKLNLLNPKIPASAQVLDNITQQVSFLPGQIFGQPQGTFKEVTIGQQYASTFSVQPQFDIINLANYAQIKSAKTNQLLVDNQNKINEQNVYDQINMVYFNILSFNEQKRILEENIIIAKDILRIIQNKFTEGIARKQEVNEAETNLISLQDKLQQIELNTEIQVQTFNLFLENSVKATLSEDLWTYENSNAPLTTQNSLLAENAKLQYELSEQEYKGLKFQNYPVLSFISSFNWQNLSNDFAFSKNSDWINFNYIGLKLSYDLPTTVTKYSNLKSKKIQLEIAKNNQEFSKKENENKNKQMILEYEKALLQNENFRKIYTLKKDTYEKNFNQFKENILPLDKLLISQNDMLTSRLNVVYSLANIGFAKAKIEISNRF
ncbi:TolC family protein [Chryseobacterium sp. PS-8]|uniref:TolC family protein n=1 Tax=Chryseobacterium indicum TaxID=2766954 RepID=A0ABS9C2F3_9FLAO|nr:TolC family protein [Chryseobacterium sp. PS-8]MCF2218490.1 TolC family protein [Chryseobacterium sp. PS-8]